MVVRDGEVIAEGVNRVTALDDPTAHAEMVAIRAACARLGSFQLSGCTIYASCEPCPMCLGAIYWARPQRLVYAADRTGAAAAGFDDALIYDEIPRPPAERQLPTERIPIATEMAPFAAWRVNTDRQEY